MNTHMLEIGRLLERCSEDELKSVNEVIGNMIRPAQASPVLDELTKDSLDHILSLSCGQLLLDAVGIYGPEETFDVESLAKSAVFCSKNGQPGCAVKTILSKNRTLAWSSKSRGIDKDNLMIPLGGNPRRFKIPEAIHRYVKETIQYCNE